MSSLGSSGPCRSWRMHCSANRDGEERVTVRKALAFIVLLPWSVAGQDVRRPPDVLPAPAMSALAASLKAAAAHAKHVWRDTAPTNPDGTVNAYIEIARGDRGCLTGAASDRRLLQTLQATSTRRVLEGAGLGHSGRRSRVHHDDPRLFPGVPGTPFLFRCQLIDSRRGKGTSLFPDTQRAAPRLSAGVLLKNSQA